MNTIDRVCINYEHVAITDDMIPRLTQKRVFLKPNISTKARGSYTHPAIVRGVADTLKARGHEVIIAEGMHLKHYKEAVLTATGYRDLAQAYPFVDLEKEKCEMVGVTSRYLDRIAVPALMLDADTVTISIPKLKTHMMTLMTGPLKNIAMGVVNQHSRAVMHRVAGSDFRLLGEMLVDVFLAIASKVPLAVIDAVEVMTGNGPSFGIVTPARRILVGDTVTLEWACLRVLGLTTCPTTEALRCRGMWQNAETVALGDRCVVPDTYRKGARAFIRRMLNREYWCSVMLGARTIRQDWYEIGIEREKCLQCGECLRHCPMEAINEFYIVDPSKCNRCLCCVENCPGGAAHIVTQPFMQFLDRIGRHFY
jgi:uncharacterized protein (DUF362 family)/NAD-dependent dihydropyrimidine dehydrogenase PreA subunit